MDALQEKELLRVLRAAVRGGYMEKKKDHEKESEPDMICPVCMTRLDYTVNECFALMEEIVPCFDEIPFCNECGSILKDGNIEPK